MTTTTRQSEADRVELVYFWALNQLGAAAAIDARALYEREVAKVPNPGSSGWLQQAIRLMFGFRKPAQDLAVAYYRLTRALRTGHTVTVTGEEAGDAVSLEQLRHDFEDIVDHIDLQTGDGDGTLPPRNLSVVDDEDIPLEAGQDIDKLIADMDEEAQAAALDELDQIGTSNLLKQLDQGRDGEEAYATARDRQAAIASRITMNAARGLAYNLASSDLRIEGWMRYSQTGTPCGWCAMLLSRGLTEKSGLYRTRVSASAKGTTAPTVVSGKNSVAEEFHTNCHCVAVPIFLDAQLDGPLFDLNRDYADLWEEHISGQFSGDAALTKWRHYVRHGFPNQTTVQVAA